MLCVLIVKRACFYWNNYDTVWTRKYKWYCMKTCSLPVCFFPQALNISCFFFIVLQATSWCLDHVEYCVYSHPYSICCRTTIYNRWYWDTCSKGLPQTWNPGILQQTKWRTGQHRWLEKHGFCFWIWFVFDILLVFTFVDVHVFTGGLRYYVCRVKKLVPDMRVSSH